MLVQEADRSLEHVTADLARLRIGFVNVFFVGAPGAAPWALVDTGLGGTAAAILQEAGARFGLEARPAAIVLTHGHIDHAGGLSALLAVWDVPVYAHVAELPFLTGRADYPPPDPTVADGPLARWVPVPPERGLDLGSRVQPLPSNGDVPGMPGWRWIHTPGHSPGHVSLFRAADRVLIAGDAVTTTRQGVAYTVLPQEPELSGPAAVFTIDWHLAEQSVAALAALEPAVVASGHGPARRDASVADDLIALSRDFESRVRPTRGRYVRQPAVIVEPGSAALGDPARSSGVRWGALSGVAAAAFAGTWLYRRFGRRIASPIDAESTFERTVSKGGGRKSPRRSP
jgi:glyoxylase-like metal-dependent hydrolase (beta-lactamase superfamily II)